MLDGGMDLNHIDRLGNTAMTIAAYYGHYDILKMLSEYGADLDKADKRGSTPLMIACYKGYYDIVRYLIQQGCNLDKEGAQGKTALMMAVMPENAEANYEIVEQLIMYGADGNIKDSFGRTVLDYCRNEEIKGYLVSQGVMRGDEIH